MSPRYTKLPYIHVCISRKEEVRMGELREWAPVPARETRCPAVCLQRARSAGRDAAGGVCVEEFCGAALAGLGGECVSHGRSERARYVHVCMAWRGVESLLGAQFTGIQ